MKLKSVSVSFHFKFAFKLGGRVRLIHESFGVLVCLRCTGGEVGATSSLAPKIGPLGLVSIENWFKSD